MMSLVESDSIVQSFIDDSEKMVKRVASNLISTKIPFPIDDPVLKVRIHEVRTSLKDDFKNNNQYIASDMERMMTHDYEVRRFLYMTNLDVGRAIELVKERLRWRKEMGIDKFKPEEFPIEFYECASVFEFKVDRQGKPVLYVRSKFNIKSDVLSKPIRQFLIYNMDLMDQRHSTERSWILVFDAQGFGWANIDFDFLHLIIKVLRNYMPWSVNFIVVYEIPRILESVWKGIQHLIPEDGKKLLKVCNKKTIREIIDPQNIPIIMGGMCVEDIVHIPKGCKTAKQLGFDGDEMQKIQKQFEKMIINDKKLMAQS